MIHEVEATRKYWLVRTFGGKYYAHFSQNNYIALGWNELSDLEMIMKADKDDEAKKKLFDKVKELYIKKENEQPGRIVNPIIRFVKDMNVGDVVVIPSENSESVRFGIIKSDVKIVTDVINLEKGLDPLYKQREVEWVTWKEKKSLDLNIFKLLSSHYAITNADEYAEYIDRTMYGIYLKNNRAYLVVEVNKEEEFSGCEISGLISSLLDTVDVYNEITGETLNKNSVNMRMQLQSPGYVQLFGNIDNILAIYAVYCLFTGGTITLPTGYQIQAKGIFDLVWEKLIQSNDQKHRHFLEKKEQEFRHTMELLKLSFPGDEKGNNELREK